MPTEPLTRTYRFLTLNVRGRSCACTVIPRHPSSRLRNIL